MVDAIQLYPRSCSQRWHCDLRISDILHINTTYNKWYRAQLVGKYVSSLPDIEFELISNFTLRRMWQKTADATGMPFKPLPESGFIGPAKWS